MIVGNSEDLEYGRSSKNSYHYITTTYYASNFVYLWENRAGKIYKSYPTNKEAELRVDKSVHS